MNGYFSNIIRLLKDGKKSDLFSAHFGRQFKSTMSCTDLLKCMEFKVVNQINPIGAMKSFMKPNCNPWMEEHLMLLENIRDN